MSRPEDRGATDALLNLLVYAPIGLLLDAESLTPELARRGRQHSAAARQIGEMAVRRGMRRLDEVIAQVNENSPPEGDVDGAETSPQADDADQQQPHSPKPTAPAISADGLAIPDYDLLAASQVVKRLGGLTEAELEAVRAYEAATRDRRTILHKIARLQG
jgi:hypothetical protein